MKTLLPALFSLCVLACGTACAPERPTDRAADAPTSAPASEGGFEGREALPVAVINGEEIPLGELERRIDAMAPYARSRYASMTQRKELLDSVVTFEVLADEAERRGLGRDPAVIYEMKAAMVRRMLLEEEKTRAHINDISDKAVQAYYEEHADEYRRPAQRRVALVQAQTQEFLQRHYEELKAQLQGAPGEEQIVAFRRLAARQSSHQESSKKGGDLGFLSARPKNPQWSEVARRAFELEGVGASSQPFEDEGTWNMVMVIDERPERVRALDSVSAEIRQLLHAQARQRARAAYIAELKKGVSIEVNEESLKKLQAPQAPADFDPSLLGKPRVRDLPKGQRPNTTQKSEDKSGEQ